MKWPLLAVFRPFSGGFFLASGLHELIREWSLGFTHRISMDCPHRVIAVCAVPMGVFFCSTILHSMVRYLVGRAISRQVLVLPNFSPRPHRPSLVSGGFLFLGIGFALLNKWCGPECRLGPLSPTAPIGHPWLVRFDGGFLFHPPHAACGS